MTTKNDMARNIIAALYNLPALPPATDRRVVRKARLTKGQLQYHYELAQKIINTQLAEGTHPSQAN